MNSSVLMGSLLPQPEKFSNTVLYFARQIGDYPGSLIVPIQEFNSDVFSDEEHKVLAEINKAYGHLSASQISQKSHEERPWIKTPPCRVISYELDSEGGELNG